MSVGSTRRATDRRKGAIKKAKVDVNLPQNIDVSQDIFTDRRGASGVNYRVGTGKRAK